MTPERFTSITEKYARLKVAVVGDFCLDRYLEIDPARQETSIETGLAVHNIINVRTQPGGAGTILNNLVALGVRAVFPVGFVGEDGEGYELKRTLAQKRGVRLDHLVTTTERHTFTYCKPLVMHQGKPPVELNRLDQKNWTPTPEALSRHLGKTIKALGDETDAFAVLSQVDQPETGIVTQHVRDVLAEVARANPGRVIVADSRHGLRGFPPVVFKMNAAELRLLTGTTASTTIEELNSAAARVAANNHRPVFVTLAERGLLGALPDGRTEYLPALPLRGEIDIVGAGDAVTATLTVALAAGATLREALELANAAASIVLHQLGTTGTASVQQLSELVCGHS